MATITASTPSIVPFPSASRQETPRLKLVRTGLLACGIPSSLLIGARRFPGYSLTNQTISELFAIGAPSRRLVASLMVVYDFLLYAFGVGVWRAAGRKRALRVTAVGMIGKEVLGLLATVFFPMHVREVLARGGATLSDELHRDLTVVGTLLMLLAMIFGATGFGKRFRLYSIATISRSSSTPGTPGATITRRTVAGPDCGGGTRTAVRTCNSS